MDIIILIGSIMPVQFLLNLTTYTSFHYYEPLTGFHPNTYTLGVGFDAILPQVL